MLGPRRLYWTKRLGSAGVLVGFVGMVLVSLVHRGLAHWADRMDQEFFYFGREHHPTSGLLAVAAAVVLGLVGVVVGLVVDRSRGADE